MEATGPRSYVPGVIHGVKLPSCTDEHFIVGEQVPRAWVIRGRDRALIQVRLSSVDHSEVFGGRVGAELAGQPSADTGEKSEDVQSCTKPGVFTKDEAPLATSQCHRRWNRMIAARSLSR